MDSGIVYGLIAAAIVWVLGFTLVKPSLTQGDILGLGRAIVFFMRTGLFIASAVLLAGLLGSAVASSNFGFFNHFAPTYVIGVVAYFFVRYKPRIRLEFRR